MNENRSWLPSADRLGIVVASVLLTYALTRIIQSPRFTLSVTLPGFYFAYPLSLSTAMTLLAAALSTTGMDWMIRDHPSLGKRSNVEHLLLPTLTTFVIGGLLGALPDGGAWWAALGLGALLLVGVYVAEYITMEPSSPNYGLARAGLTALAFAIFLIMVTALRFTGPRMFLVVPVVFVAAGLISLRILHLDGTDRWDFPWAAGIGIVCAQLGAALHYWPLVPIQFGLALTGPLYALTILSGGLNTENIPLRRAVAGPLIILGLAWAAAILIR